MLTGNVLGCVLAGALLLAGCGAQQAAPPAEEAGISAEAPSAQEMEPQAGVESAAEEEETTMKMQVQIGDSAFTATLADTAAADALAEMLAQAPLVIQAADYGGFEKVGELGTRLPSDNRQTTTQAGDIVLYSGDQIVLFYGSNTWSYTRLARIDSLTGWEQALGSGDVTVTLSLAE